MNEAVYKSVPKCADLTGISKDYLYNLCHSGTAEYIKIGKKFLIHYPHLLEYLESEAKKNVRGKEDD